MKRRSKFAIWLAALWPLGTFPVWMPLPRPASAMANGVGFLEGVALIVVVVGSLVWVVWPRRSS